MTTKVILVVLINAVRCCLVIELFFPDVSSHTYHVHLFTCPTCLPLQLSELTPPGSLITSHVTFPPDTHKQHTANLPLQLIQYTTKQIYHKLHSLTQLIHYVPTIWRTVADVDEAVIVAAETSVVVAVAMATSVLVEEEEDSMVVIEAAAEVASMATVVEEAFEEIEAVAFAVVVAVSRDLESLGKYRLKNAPKCILT